MKKKKRERPIDPVKAISRQLEEFQLAQLPAFECRLDPEVRRVLAPEEERDHKAYLCSFDFLKDALRDNARAMQALLRLDELTSALAESQGQISRACAFALGERMARR